VKTKSAKTVKSRKQAIGVMVVLTRYYRYDFGGGGMPLGHDRDDAADLKFSCGKSVWRARYQAVKLQKFVEKHGKPVGERQHLPYDRDYSSQSYKQAYLFPKEFTATVVGRLVSLYD